MSRKPRPQPQPRPSCTQAGGCFCSCYLCKAAPDRPGPLSHCESHISGCHKGC